ncbi:MAG: hypothetical protein AAB661_00545 [Patescibacteria group bacterium]
MATGRPQPDDFLKKSGTETQGETPPDLTIAGITAQVEDLKKRVAAAQLAKQADIERQVGEHDAMRAQLPGLIESLQITQDAIDYFTSTKAAGEFREEDEPKLKEIETTATALQSQIAVMEARINFFGSQPDIFDHIHAIALTMRDGEKKGEIMSQGIESLTTENSVIAEEVKNSALELRETIRERDATEQKLGALRQKIEKFLETAMQGLDSGKHWDTYELLNGHKGVPTVEQLRERRGQLKGFGHGKEKAAIDIMLQQSDLLEEYRKLRDADKVLEEQVFGKPKETRIAQIRQRIEEHMIKAWELHEQTGIRKSLYEEPRIDAPEKVFADLQDKIDSLGGRELVEKQEHGKLVRVREVVHDTSEKKAIRVFWETASYYSYGKRSGERLSFCTFRKPTLESD